MCSRAVNLVTALTYDYLGSALFYSSCCFVSLCCALHGRSAIQTRGCSQFLVSPSRSTWRRHYFSPEDVSCARHCMDSLEQGTAMLRNGSENLGINAYPSICSYPLTVSPSAPSITDICTAECCGLDLNHGIGISTSGDGVNATRG